MSNAPVCEATNWGGSQSLALFTSIIHSAARPSMSDAVTTAYPVPLKFGQYTCIYLSLCSLTLFHLSEWHPGLWRREFCEWMVTGFTKAVHTMNLHNPRGNTFTRNSGTNTSIFYWVSKLFRWWQTVNHSHGCAWPPLVANCFYWLIAFWFMWMISSYLRTFEFQQEANSMDSSQELSAVHATYQNQYTHTQVQN